MKHEQCTARRGDDVDVTRHSKRRHVLRSSAHVCLDAATPCPPCWHADRRIHRETPAATASPATSLCAWRAGVTVRRVRSGSALGDTTAAGSASAVDRWAGGHWTEAATALNALCVQPMHGVRSSVDAARRSASRCRFEFELGRVDTRQLPYCWAQSHLFVRPCRPLHSPLTQPT